MKKRLMAQILTGGAALVVMFFGGVAAGAQSTDSDHVNSLLQQVKEDAAQAYRDAELIDSFVRSRTSWQSHATQLTSMKEHVNSMGQHLANLEEAKPEASPWQQEAIRDVDPLLRSMADHLNSMIQHLNDNQNKVHLQPWVDYTRANLELSDKLLATIRDYVDYSQARARADALEQKLELPAPSGTGEQ